MSDAAPSAHSGFADIHSAKIYYETRGAGEPLVLLHAGWLDSRMWEPQIDVFARRFTVIRYDLRGFGRSSLPDAPYSDVQDLYELLRFLGLRRAALLGLSHGGTVAIDFALANPAAVSALVLAGAGLRGFEPSPEDDVTAKTIDMISAVQTGDRPRALDLFMELWVDGVGRQAAPEVRARVRALAEDYSFAHIVAGAPQPTHAPSAIERLSTIRAPTLVLVGAHDQPPVHEIAGLLEVEIPGARRVVIPDAAHLPSLEQPELFNQAVLDFLEAHAGDKMTT